MAPLDWGLGHATRCIPIIHHLLEKNCAVTIACDGHIREILALEFPGVPFSPLKGYGIRYPKKGLFFMPMMLLQVPRILAAIWTEQRWLQQKAHQFDLVISDNRYGLHTTKADAVLITHQLQVPTGWGKVPDRIIEKCINRLVSRFDAVWIPDEEHNGGIAGMLSHPAKLSRTAQFIGPLSRVHAEGSVRPGKILVMLSGPEPQRTVLEQKLIAELETSCREVVFVRGVHKKEEKPKTSGRIHFENHLDAQALSVMVAEAEIIVCRSGYSSIMDLLKMRKKALLIPTPGQTEQLYLARRSASLHWFAVELQENLNLERGLEKAMELNLSNRPVFNFDEYKHALSTYGI